MSKTAPLLLIALTALSSLTLASEPSTPEHAAFTSYETIRQALLHDKLEGVAEAARQLANHAKELGLQEENSTAKKALETVATTFSQLSAAGDIAAVREAFGDLSDAMIKYRNTLNGEKSFVAYCSMAKEYWLQPTDKIGNPYYGQSMASCGEIITSEGDS